MKTTRYIKAGISFVLILSLMLQLFPHIGLFSRASASITAGDTAAIVSSDTLVSPTDNTVTAETPPTFIDQTQPLVAPAAAAAEPNSDTVTEPGTDQQVFPTFVTSPFSYSGSDSERVAMNTGALTYESVDYVLPGINGLDLVIGHRYRSDYANVYNPKIDWVSTSNFVYGVNIVGTAYLTAEWRELIPYPEEGCNETIGPFESYQAAEEFAAIYDGETETEENFKPGYTLYIEYSAEVVIVDIPPYSGYYTTSRDLNTDPSFYELGYGWEFMFSSIRTIGNSKFLHLSNGAVYQFGSSPSGLKDYHFTDMVLDSNIREFTSGQVTSHYRLSYQNGTREYFSQDGKLIGIQDRFGNTIRLEHNVQNDLPFIRITDTLNRVTIISGTPTETGHTMTVSLPDGTQLSYQVEQSATQEDVTSLARYTDPAGQQTQYSYTLQSAGFNAIYRNTAAETNIHVNLTTITHPTQAQTVYTYTVDERFLGSDGLTEVYKLASREDRVGDTVSNRLTYTYSFDDCSGWPSCTLPLLIPATFTYYTTVTDDRGVSTTTNFNYQHLNNSVILRDDIRYLKKTFYEYDENRIPIETTTELYNYQSFHITLIEPVEYDEKGNITASWSPLAGGDTTDTEYKTTSTYDSTYGLLLTQTYKTDADTTVRLVNTLDESKKNIISTAVYINDVLTRKTDYAYDTFGNVTSQKQYLDNMTDYVLTEYTYQNGAYLTQEKHTGLVTADGTAASSTPGQSAGTVVTTHTWDTMGRRLSTTDGNGKTTRYTYDILGNVTSVTNPDNTSVTQVWNYATNTVTTTDENGTQILCTYTPLGLEYELIDVETNAVLTRKEYDSCSRLIRLTDFVSGAVTEYTYDHFDRVLTERVYEGSTLLSEVTHFYNEAAERGLYQAYTKTVTGDTNAPSVITIQYLDIVGNVYATGRKVGTQERMDVSTLDYMGNPVTTLTHADSWNGLDVSSTMMYNEMGQLVSATNALNQTTTNTYDTLGRLTRSTDYAGTPTDYTYDNLGRLLSQTFTIEEGVTASTKYEYDPAGNLIREYKPTNAVGEAATWARTDYTYDSRGRLTAVVQYEGDTVESVTRYTYDGVGNTLSMTTGLTSLDDTTGNTTTYTYDRFGNLLTTTDALGKTETNTYSDLGKHLSTTDRNGNTTVYTYDALGRVVSAVCGADTLQYTYTLTGQVRSETRGNVQTLYNYDSQGRVTQVTESPFAYVKAYTYDRADNRTAMTVKRNNATVQAVTYTYDTLNRLSTVSENGTLQATYTYDTNGNRASLTYANGVAETYQYNKANWITALTNSKDGDTLSSYAYTYYASGSQKSETDHNNVVTSYTYDDLGRLTQESETGELAVSYAYDANGNRIRMTVGNPPVIITLDPNGGTLLEGTATQITLPVEEGYTLPTPVFPFMTFTGWYLDDTEITDENLSQITASCTLTAQWDDDLGGIIIGPIDPIFPPTPPPEIMSETPEEEDDEGENTTSYTVTYTYDANNRLVAEVSDESGANVLTAYTYDDNGNLLSQLNVDNTAIVTHAYDGFNRLVSSVTGDGTITYTYNAQGIRTSRTVGVTTTNYLLDGGNVIVEVTGTTTTTYLRGINLISGSGKFYLYNAHGDVVQLTDSTGTVTKNYSYDAFGNEKNPDESDTNPFRYCGEYYDTETGLYYLRARYYDPLIGRFTQEDTHWNTANMIYGDNPQKINEREDALGLKTYSYAPELLSILQAGNLYVYCLSNPLFYIDNGGQFAGAISGAIAGAIGGGLSALFQGRSFWKGAVAGAVGGAISGLGLDAAVILSMASGGAAAIIGVGVTVVFAAFGSFIQSILDQWLHNPEEVSMENAFISAGIGAAFSLVSFGLGKMVGDIFQLNPVGANLFWKLVDVFRKAKLPDYLISIIFSVGFVELEKSVVETLLNGGEP